ncbi:MAG: hypothetical protein H6807_15255 [Planctomycetes bacterium]|nr:hypothetical protein [Planctomycetota bacterium]
MAQSASPGTTPACTYLSLDGNAPEFRLVDLDGHLVATPLLGELHHRYHCAA